jgi:hypothetical protein
MQAALERQEDGSTTTSAPHVLSNARPLVDEFGDLPSYNVGANYDANKLPLRIRLALKQVLYMQVQGREPTAEDATSLAVQLICQYESAPYEHTLPPTQKMKDDAGRVEAAASSPARTVPSDAVYSTQEGTAKSSEGPEILDVEEALRIVTEACCAEPKRAKWFKLDHNDELELDAINGMAPDELEVRLEKDIVTNEEEQKGIKIPKWCPCACCKSKSVKQEQSAKVAPEGHETFEPQPKSRSKKKSRPRGNNKKVAPAPPPEDDSEV